MPFVRITTVKELVDDKVRKELQKRISDLMVEIEGGGDESFRQFVWVMFDLVEAENWSICGNILDKETAQAIKAKAEAANPGKP